MRILLKSKIHNAVVTEANINYEGSISIPENLMEEADIIEGEQVHVYNITNGARFITYAIKDYDAKIAVNGAAAKLCFPGDRIIIVAFGVYSEEESKNHKAKIVIVDNQNRIIKKYEK